MYSIKKLKSLEITYIKEMDIEKYYQYEIASIFLFIFQQLLQLIVLVLWGHPSAAVLTKEAITNSTKYVLLDH